MSGRIAERLIILNDACRGLLARCHGLLSFKRPAVIDSSIDKVCQKLLKRFPEFHASAVEKIAGFKEFKQQASEIHDSLQAFYSTLVDIYQLKEEAMKVLNDVAGDILDLKFDLNRDIVIWFLDLLVGTTQLLLLLDQVPNRREYSVVYALAYFYTQSTYESNFQSVAKFIVDFSPPIRKLQADCEQLSHRVGHTLIGIESFMRNINFESIRDKHLLSLSECSEGISQACSKPIYQDLLLVSRFRLWVAYGFLVCPAELQLEEARELVRNTLGMSMVVPVYRNVFANLHEEYETTFNHFKSKKVKLSKFAKELLKTSHANAINDSSTKHAEARNFLRSDVSMMRNLLEEFPGLLGPKFPVVLAALSLLKHEIFWYFLHLDASQRLASANPKDWKKFTDNSFIDRNVGELVFEAQKLLSLISTHSDVVRNYYIKMLALDIDNMQAVGDELQNDKRISKFVKSLVTDLIKTSPEDIEANPSATLEAFRMNWYRVSIAFTSAQGGSRSGAAKQLMNESSSVMFHTRCVDSLHELGLQCGSLHELYYQRRLLLAMFRQCMLSGGGHPRFCMTYLHILGSTMNNVHRFYPEEKATLTTEAVAEADRYLQRVADHLESMIRRAFTEALQLSYQVRPEEAAKRRQALLNGEPNENYPGCESLAAARPTILHIEQTRHNIAHICSAIRYTKSVRVLDHVFTPAQYVHDTMKKGIRDILRRLANTDHGNIERPSRFLVKTRCLIRSMHELAAHINMDMRSLLSEILLSEFYENDIASVGLASSVDVVSRRSDAESRGGGGGGDNSGGGGSEDDASCGDMYWQFYSTQLIEWLQRGGIVYSELSLGFVSRRRNIGVQRSSVVGTSATSLSLTEGGSVLLAQDYTDVRELRDFCTFAGPHGVVALERRLLAMIASRAERIKRILLSNSSTLRTVSRRMAQATVWVEGVKKLRSMDELFQHSVAIGSLLRFRRTLFEALRQVVEERIGFLADAVRHVDRAEPDGYSPDGVKALLLAHQCGLDDPLKDVNLQNALRSLKVTHDDEALWKLLSCMYGFHFVCSSWSRTVFEISTYAHTNNGNCVAECIKSLVITMQAIQLDDSSQDDPLIVQNIHDHLRSFLRFASYTIFHMKARHQAYGNHHLQSIKIFLHDFVNINDTIGMNELEETLPFTIIRTDLIELHEQQSQNGRIMFGADEDKEDAD